TFMGSRAVVRTPFGRKAETSTPQSPGLSKSRCATYVPAPCKPSPLKGASDSPLKVPVEPLRTKERTCTVASLTGVLWSVIPIGTRCCFPTTSSDATPTACSVQLPGDGLFAEDLVAGNDPQAASSSTP